MTEPSPRAEAARIVLVVDDDPTVGHALRRVLTTAGVQVVVQTRPFGVLNALAEHRPVLLVVDVMMPGLDGPQIVSLIRADPDLAKTPVILYSGIDEGDLARRATECGANGHLSKTLRPVEILKALRPWLDG